MNAKYSGRIAAALALALGWADAAAARNDCGAAQPIPEAERQANGPDKRVVCNAASATSANAFNGADGIQYRDTAGLEITKDDATPVQQIANLSQQGGATLRVQAGAVVQQHAVSGSNLYDHGALYAWSSAGAVRIETAAGVSLATETARREAVYARSGSLRQTLRTSNRNVRAELERILALQTPSAEQMLRVTLGGPVATSGQSANAVFAYAEEGGAVRVEAGAGAAIRTSGAKLPGLADNRRERNNGYGIAAWSGLFDAENRGPGGPVWVSAQGGIATRAAYGAGIHARSSGGPVRVEARGAITTLGWQEEAAGPRLVGMAPGIVAQGFGAGAAGLVSVDSRGAITTGMRGRPNLGAESHGILAEASGPRSAPVQVRAGAVTTWPERSHGIHASSLGAVSGGAVQVRAHGRIETRGSGSHGIFTRASYGETLIHLAPSAALEVFGKNAAALRAESALPSGATGTPGALRIEVAAGALLAARGSARHAISLQGGRGEIEIAGLLHGALQGGVGDETLNVLAGGAWTLLGDSDFGGGRNALHNAGTLQVGRGHSLDSLALRGLASFTQAESGALRVNISSREGRGDLLELGGAAVTLAGRLEVTDLNYAPGAVTLNLLRTTGALDISALTVEHSAARNSALRIVNTGAALQVQPPAPDSPAPAPDAGSAPAGSASGGLLQVLRTTNYAPAALSTDRRQIGAWLNRLGGADPDDSETGLLAALAGIADMNAYARALDHLNPAGYGALLQSAWWAQSAFAADLLAADCGGAAGADLALPASPIPGRSPARRAAASAAGGEGRCFWLRTAARGLRRRADTPGGNSGARFGFAEDAPGLSAGLRLPLAVGGLSLGAAVEQSELEVFSGEGGTRRRWGAGDGLRLLAGAAFSARSARLELGGGIGGGYARHEIARETGAGAQVQSAPRLHWAGGHLRAGLRFAPGGWQVQPQIEASALFARASGLTERGGARGALRFAIADTEARWLALGPGLVLSGGIPAARGALRLRLALGARWFARAAPPRWQARPAGAADAAGDFALRGAAPEALLAELGLGLGWQGPRLALQLGYATTAGAKTRLHSGGLGLRWRF